MNNPTAIITAFTLLNTCILYTVIYVYNSKRKVYMINKSIKILIIILYQILFLKSAMYFPIPITVE